MTTLRWVAARFWVVAAQFLFAPDAAARQRHTDGTERIPAGAGNASAAKRAFLLRPIAGRKRTARHAAPTAEALGCGPGGRWPYAEIAEPDIETR
jgi:hypothetical protein